MQRVRLALLNVLRNGRRTTLSVAMIAVGIAAIVIIEGFTANQLSQVEDVAINSQFGNIQIANKKHWTLSTADQPKDRLVKLDPKLEDQISHIPGVRYVSERLSFYGLLSNSGHTLSSRGIGFNTDREVQMKNSLHIVSGRNFADHAKFELLIGSGLQQQLQVKLGDSITIISYTFDGSMNAIDCELVGIFQTGAAEIDNTTFYVPVATAQHLMDTSQAENYIVQLWNRDLTDSVQSKVAALIPAESGSKTWLDLAVFFKQVANFDRVQSLIAISIVLSLALLAVANTIGMSISERIGEIGTVRAMGDNRQDVLTQFLLEGLILGALGGICGMLLAVSATYILNWVKIPIFFPGASVSSFIVIEIIPVVMMKAVVLTCITSVIASFLPALRATQLNIVDALKRNI